MTSTAVTSETAQSDTHAAKPAAKSRRLLVMAALPLALIVGAGLWWLLSQGHQSTENANLHQARLSVASSLSGRVVISNVTDNRHVTKGDLLFQIDPEPYRIALRQAEVGLDAARLQVKGLKAGYAQAEAQLKLARDTVSYTATNLKRQQALTKRGVTSDSALDDSRHTALSAEQNAVAADMALKAALAALGGDAEAPIDAHPTVRAAAVARDNAAYALSQTEMRAPADGILYQAASFRLGQMVAAGSTLFTLVETGNSWVEANFKESQLADIRPGQSVEIRLDSAPDLRLSGTVEAIGAGTGAEFSLLPAQNATGNWVKVEQRVPVRIRLDPERDIPFLASGLSADVTVNTRDTGTPERAEAQASAPRAESMAEPVAKSAAELPEAQRSESL